MSDPKDAEISLKVMINEEKTKVLFAEAGTDFVDVLLSFLTLPLGTIVRVLNKHYRNEAPVFGSLTNLYKGLADLDSASFWSEAGKQMLLNPRSSFEGDNCKLKINVDDTQPTNYFRCGDGVCNRKRSALVSMYHDKVKCDCGKYMSRPMGTMLPQAESDGDGDIAGVFTDKNVSFLISDDLRMAPVVPGSMIQTLIDLGITVTSGAELRTVTLGFNDFMDFLAGCLHSSTTLTDLVLRTSCTSRDGLVGDLRSSSSSSSSLDSKKMTVKAWVQKADPKLLFVEAEQDFVDFLFGLLIIPLGGVEFLLGGRTLLRNIDNLYTSVANLIDEKYLKTTNIKRQLMKPELPPNYHSKNQIFSMDEQPNPTIYFLKSIAHSPEHTVEKGSWMRFKDPKGDQGTYVKKPGKFLVRSNLSVTSLHSINSVLEEMDVCSTDNVTELKLHIGLEEALNILKASLTSKAALSDGLSNQISEKLRAQEIRNSGESINTCRLIS